MNYTSGVNIVAAILWAGWVAAWMAGVARNPSPWFLVTMAAMLAAGHILVAIRCWGKA